MMEPMSQPFLDIVLLVTGAAAGYLFSFAFR